MKIRQNYPKNSFSSLSGLQGQSSFFAKHMLHNILPVAFINTWLKKPLEDSRWKSFSFSSQFAPKFFTCWDSQAIWKPENLVISKFTNFMERKVDYQKRFDHVTDFISYANFWRFFSRCCARKPFFFLYCLILFQMYFTWVNTKLLIFLTRRRLKRWTCPGVFS